MHHRSWDQSFKSESISVAQGFDNPHFIPPPTVMEAPPFANDEDWLDREGDNRAGIGRSF